MVAAATPKPKRLFSLGNIYATPGAIETLNESGQDVSELLRRHVSGDWGDLESEDKQANDDALNCGARIFSAYGEGDKKLWVITEWDRSATQFFGPMNTNPSKRLESPAHRRGFDKKGTNP